MLPSVVIILQYLRVDPGNLACFLRTCSLYSITSLSLFWPPWYRKDEVRFYHSYDFAMVCVYFKVYQGDKYFSFHMFFCLQQLNLKFEVIAQASPTNIKCNESFISSKFKKEGRLIKVNFRKKKTVTVSSMNWSPGTWSTFLIMHDGWVERLI